MFHKYLGHCSFTKLYCFCLLLLGQTCLTKHSTNIFSPDEANVKKTQTFKIKILLFVNCKKCPDSSTRWILKKNDGKMIVVKVDGTFSNHLFLFKLHYILGMGVWPPPRIPVSTRIVTFLIRDPNKASSTTIASWEGAMPEPCLNLAPVLTLTKKKHENSFPKKNPPRKTTLRDQLT